MCRCECCGSHEPATIQFPLRSLLGIPVGPGVHGGHDYIILTAFIRDPVIEILRIGVSGHTFQASFQKISDIFHILLEPVSEVDEVDLPDPHFVQGILDLRGDLIMFYVEERSVLHGRPDCPVGRREQAFPLPPILGCLP